MLLPKRKNSNVRLWMQGTSFQEVMEGIVKDGNGRIDIWSVKRLPRLSKLPDGLFQ